MIPFSYLIATIYRFMFIWKALKKNPYERSTAQLKTFERNVFFFSFYQALSVT